jgi:hypothetical protein
LVSIGICGYYVAGFSDYVVTFQYVVSPLPPSRVPNFGWNRNLLALLVEGTGIYDVSYCTRMCVKNFHFVADTYQFIENAGSEKL